jgi:hypothetical protein
VIVVKKGPLFLFSQKSHLALAGVSVLAHGEYELLLCYCFRSFPDCCVASGLFAGISHHLELLWAIYGHETSAVLTFFERGQKICPIH